MTKNSLLTFRIANTADYARFAALISHVEGRTITGDTLQSWDAHKIEKDIFYRYAACLDEEIISFGDMQKLAVTQFPQFAIWLTIDAAYRRRGFGGQFYDFLAQYAISKGAQVIVTDNDSENAPMLAINNKMGYVRQPGTYWLVKRPLSRTPNKLSNATTVC